jgi:hypothetical protein
MFEIGVRLIRRAPSLKGRGWGWVGQLEPQPFAGAETQPTPGPALPGRGEADQTARQKQQRRPLHAKEPA